MFRVIRRLHIVSVNWSSGFSNGFCKKQLLFNVWRNWSHCRWFEIAVTIWELLEVRHRSCWLRVPPVSAIKTKYFLPTARVCIGVVLFFTFLNVSAQIVSTTRVIVGGGTRRKDESECHGVTLCRRQLVPGLYLHCWSTCVQAPWWSNFCSWCSCLTSVPAKYFFLFTGVRVTPNSSGVKRYCFAHSLNSTSSWISAPALSAVEFAVQLQLRNAVFW